MNCISLSTTIRNPERLIPHLRVFEEINREGFVSMWNPARKQEYLIRLIQRRVVRPQEKGLPKALCQALAEEGRELTREEAGAIFAHKNYGKGTTARVNAILSHLELWGLAEVDYPVVSGALHRLRVIETTQAGQDILSGSLDFRAHMETMLPRWGFPHVHEGTQLLRPQLVIHPFPATLALILEANRLAAVNGLEPQGILCDEFDLYALTFRNKEDFHDRAQRIIAYRIVMQDPAYSEKQKFHIHGQELDRLGRQYAGLYNAADYSDVIFRYFALSKYIVLPHKMSHIDINPALEQEAREMAEQYMRLPQRRLP